MGDSKGKGDGSGGLKRNTGGSSLKKIDSYFIKKPRLEIAQSKNLPTTTTHASASTATLPTFTLDEEKSCSSVINDIQPILSTSTSDSDQIKTSVSQSEFASDIACYIGNNIDDSSKAMLLEKHWQPPPNYTFPHCVVNKKGKQTKKYAQKSHLDKFHWLVLSHKGQGLYCKYCALFAIAPRGGIQTKTHLCRLVKEPLKAFDNLLGENGVLLTHQRNKYHELAVEAGKNFLLTFHKPEFNIMNQVSSQRLTQINENRERLRPIVKTIIFCGRQNISLRGHRDDGKLLSYDSVVADEGNFRALLKFRIDSGDTALQQHLESSKSNATYISKTVQNELIDVCAEIIQENILQNIREAKFFSILFDETTDISHISHLSLSFRYFHNGIIKEHFVTFCDTYDALRREENNSGDIEPRLTGVSLAKIVANLCTKFNVDITWCVGIGTDSCSVMASETKGAVQELTKIAIHAKRCPCNNHVLNNSLARSSKVVSCRNTSGTMRKVVAFANASAKRHEIFKKELGVAMQGICETRWVERHDGHLQFQGDNLVKICSALEKISTWQDSKTANDAHCLLQTLRSSDFIISSICLSDVLGVTVSLSRILQSNSIDLKKAADAINDTISVLQNKRENADVIYRQLFEEAKEVAGQLDVEIKCPRIVSRQIHRANNQPAQSAEEYFRRAIYIPLLDSIINDLEDRMSLEVLNLFQLSVFMPKSEYSNQDIETVKQLATDYTLLLDNTPVSVVVNEYRLWMMKWQRSQDMPQSISDLILNCDIEMYPNIRKFLCIMATLPVSIATAERSFSTLRRIKSWLRAAMVEERLTGLALLHVHKNIPIEADEVITRFGRRRKRKIDFVI
ncbi:52 kDa repressor of the inhibitor of the protein kinase isoform X1 [Tribolium castaneum]|uniref:52 kDa repressor of the inhibitor of the protein kinase isoform X1 n=2 Tax=Tribolium castaneum TaxID=7070 RepID=UPI00077DB5BA|nr:PREDICTED: 52 kDa repressor of the inhibitor of the protein kinase-like isoform X1 [Tribolium castaneum]|eukprot:XP_015836603.1 PREDICTED: 52 kDa repressor of the inhibitor of the protein kinase-like isoform X1 [Tribolium castaneum]